MLARSDEHRLRIRVEELEEENRQLRERLARATGRPMADRAREVFGLTLSEAVILVFLTRCGRASYTQLEDAIYAETQIEAMDNTRGALRSHAKRLRRKIRPYVDFTTVYSFGFEMSEEARVACRKRLS